MIPFIKIITCCFLLLFQSAIYANNKIYVPFSDINELNLFIDEEEYKDFIRASLFQQPEFNYINSLSAEEGFKLKFARRERFPTINGNIINDESIERNISDNSSVRKRRDDSFDANIEIRQNIYTGGSISSRIKSAKARVNILGNEKQKTISELIIEANKVYLNAVTSGFLLNYAENLINTLRPYKDRVKERVNAGIMDPVESALFSVRYNRLESLIYQLKSQAEKNSSRYKYFFKKDITRNAFPRIYTEYQSSLENSESYEVSISKSKYTEKKEEIKTVRSDYLPKLGLSARYTKYDIDDDSNEDDIRGGLFFSMPIFSFGRGAAKINAAKASALGSKNNISISKKDDAINESSFISDYNNSIMNKEAFISSFQDTVLQRKTLQERIEFSGFAINPLAEVISNEISQLQILLDNEAVSLITYLSILHQNQLLNNEFKIKVDR
tara:strand:- start:2034 stop:3362 length:1329 start_codon:yes stop_codon:yes gene_type:complete